MTGIVILILAWALLSVLIQNLMDKHKPKKTRLPECLRR